MDETAVVEQENLSPSFLDKLENYEDYLSFYMQLEEASTAFSWLKADTLHRMNQKLGDKSLEQLAKDLKQKKSTVVSYIRVAKAFPQETRNPAASFSAHYQASYADSFNDKTQEFTGEKRFVWIQKATDDNLSTREIAEGIQAEKRQLLSETDGDEVARAQDAIDKVKKMKILLDGLLKAARKGDNDAYQKIIIIHDKIYG